jgi:U3 small nucleolar RNA-associated protein 15
LNQLKVTHVAKYSAPIMSMGLSPSCNTLAVGASTGLLSIRQRREPKSIEEEPASALDTIQPRSSKRLHPNNYRYFLRGHSEVTAADNVVARPKQQRLRQHDKFLRQFQYREALSSALSTSDAMVVVAVMEELVARGGLVSAISNRDAPSLEPLLAFLCNYAVIPKQSRLLIPVAHKVLDMYANMFGLSSTIKNLVSLLQSRVLAELKLQQMLQHLQGVMQPLLHASALGVENPLK